MTTAGLCCLYTPSRADGGAGGGGDPYGIRTRLFVDRNSLASGVPDGSPEHPYLTVQAAVDHAIADPGGLLTWHIIVAFGNYTGDPALDIPENFDFVIEGVIRRGSGIMDIGAVNWDVTGNGTSRLAFRNARVGLVTITDGTAPATNAVLTFENAGVIGGVARAGGSTSVVTCIVAGISFAGLSGLTSPIVSSIVEGNISIPSGALWMSGTQVRAPATLITAGTIRAQGCSFEVDISLNGVVAELVDSRWVGTPVITFTGAAGTVTLDENTGFSFLSLGGDVVNGVKDWPAVFSAAVAIEPSSVLPRFNSTSIYLSFVLGSQTDANYSGGGNGGLYAGARTGASGSPPLLAPFVGLSIWDFGSGTGLDAGRVLYYGGGGWDAPDVHNHQFYGAPTYSETVDAGVLLLHLNYAVGADFKRGFRLSGIISPGSIGVSQNNYNPTGLDGASVVRQVTSAAVSITGLAGGASGRKILLINIGTSAVNMITLTHEDALSTAANRFHLRGAASIVIPNGGAVELWYDVASTRWRAAATAI